MQEFFHGAGGTFLCCDIKTKVLWDTMVILHLFVLEIGFPIIIVTLNLRKYGKSGQLMAKNCSTTTFSNLKILRCS